MVDYDEKKIADIRAQIIEKEMNESFYGYESDEEKEDKVKLTTVYNRGGKPVKVNDEALANGLPEGWTKSKPKASKEK